MVVHGAGSFGHFEAKAAGLSRAPARVSVAGVAATRAAVGLLHASVVDGLVTAGVPALSVAQPMWDDVAACGAVRRALGAGFVPVLHGDVVFAEGGDDAAAAGEVDAAARGAFAVCGGDRLVQCLLAAVPAVERVVFVSDVPGLLTAPPADGGVLIPSVAVSPSGACVFGGAVDATSRAHDVTGGVMAKVHAAAQLVIDAKRPLDVRFVGRDRCEAAMGGTPDVGTTFTVQPLRAP